MKYEEIKPIADKYVCLMRPFCKRIEIAGSVRRKKPECKDIEICIIPYNASIIPLQNTVNKWKKVKGEVTGKYTQRILPEGVKLDLFICNEDNWGLNFAIRTGSAEFSHKILARKWCQMGYKSVGAILMKDNKSFPLKEEQDVFKFLGLDWVEPENREVKNI